MTKDQPTPDVRNAPRRSSCVVNALAISLAVVFVLSAVIGLLGFDVWRVLFNPTLVKQALTTEVVSSDVVPALLEVFSEWRAEQRVANNESLSGVNEPDIVLLISFLKTDNWREIKQLLVTDEFVTHLISVGVDGLYGWLDSDDVQPTIVWDMTPLKSRMIGPEGIDAIMVAYSTMPVCTENEIADFQQRLSRVPPGVEVLYNLCQFPDPWYEDQVRDYVDALKGVDENIPARFNASEELSNPTDASNARLVQLKAQLRLIRLIGKWDWSVTLVLLLLILAIRVRSMRSLGQFVGIPLVITGALTLLFALVGKASLILLVTQSLLTAVSDFARQEIQNSLNHLTGLFFQPLLIQGIILAGVGIALIALMSIKKPPARG